MVIRREQKGNQGMFYVETTGDARAEMSYHMNSPDLMVIEHTEVDEALRGQNVGHQLVEASVKFARQHRIRIKVLCPFARSVFDKNPEWQDVLHKDI